MAVYCDNCRVKVEEDWKKQDAERVATDKARAAQEREKRLLDARYAALGGPEPYLEFTFEKYQPELNGTQQWFNFAKSFPMEAKNLFVYGPTGTGKTRLCTSKVRTMWEKTPPGTVLAMSAKQLLTRVKFNSNGRPRNSYDQQEAMIELAGIDALFLDELDKIEPREKDINLLQELVDYRARQRKYGLIIAANVDLKNLATTMGMPLADRIDGKTFAIFQIPENTPSARGLLKRAVKAEKK